MHFILKINKIKMAKNQYSSAIQEINISICIILKYSYNKENGLYCVVKPRKQMQAMGETN